MGQVSAVNRRRLHELNPSLSAEFFEVGTKDGHSFVGVKLEKKLADGGFAEFRTDLGRLEFIEKQAAKYEASGSKEGLHERVGDVHVWLKRLDFGEKGEAVGVQMFQRSRDNTHDEQRIATISDDLTKTVEKGQEFGRDIGLDQKWYVLVNENSLTADASGRVRAQAVKSFASEDAALEHLGKSTGLALYSEPQGREFNRGESIELWGDATLHTKGNEPIKSVEKQLSQTQFNQERMSENYVVAQWKDVSKEPVIGERASWSRSPTAYNLEPQDFLAGPVNGKDHLRDQGVDGDTKWVLIEKGQGVAANGRIVGFSDNKREMTDELARREARTQEVTRDWEKQSFGMDRNQFTQNQSM